MKKFKISKDQNKITHRDGTVTIAIIDEMKSCLDGCFYSDINCIGIPCKRSDRISGLGVIFKLKK